MPIQSFTLSESTSRAQTQTITVPNLKSINSIRVNTGNVSITSVVGNVVTLSLSGGSSTRSVQTGGSYTPSDSKTATDSKTFYGEVMYLCGLNKTWTISKRENPVVASTLSYNKDGYYGALSLSNSTSVYGDPSLSGTACSENGTSSSSTLSQSGQYSGTVTKPSSDTRTYTYYYQYIVTVDFVDNAAPVVTLKSSGNSTLSEGQIIQKYDKNNFSFNINANDTDASDTLQYSVWFKNVVRSTWANIAKNTDITYTVPYSEMLTGNNVVTVKARDDKGRETSITFTLRNITPNSYCQADVHTLMTALGYSVSGASSLQALKPSGYNKSTISLAELVNHLT